MARRHGERDGRNSLVAHRDLRLGQRVLAVVEALEGEGRVGVGFCHRDNFRAAAQQFLRQREFRALQRLVVLVHLVHDHLVCEHDDGIPIGLRGAVTRRAALVQARVVAVLQFGLVHVAIAAVHRLIVQLSSEQHYDILACQTSIDRASVLACVRVLIGFPIQRQVKAFRGKL